MKKLGAASSDAGGSQKGGGFVPKTVLARLRGTYVKHEKTGDQMVDSIEDDKELILALLSAPEHSMNIHRYHQAIASGDILKMKVKVKADTALWRPERWSIMSTIHCSWLESHLSSWADNALIDQLAKLKKGNKYIVIHLFCFVHGVSKKTKLPNDFGNSEECFRQWLSSRRESLEDRAGQILSYLSVTDKDAKVKWEDIGYYSLKRCPDCSRPDGEFNQLYRKNFESDSQHTVHALVCHHQ